MLLALVVFTILLVWGLVALAGIEVSLLLTGLGGFVAWSVKHHHEQKKERMRLLAESKREQYLEFLEFFNRFMSGDASELSSDEAFLGEFRMWSLRLTLIGSDDVIRAWNVARTGNSQPEGACENLAVLVGWGRLWLEMRKDAGHANTQLEVPDILASFVNDVDALGLKE